MKVYYFSYVNGEKSAWGWGDFGSARFNLYSRLIMMGNAEAAYWAARFHEGQEPTEIEHLGTTFYVGREIHE